MKKIMMISHSTHGGGAETVFYKTVETLKKQHLLTIIVNSNKGVLFEKLKNKEFEIEEINFFSLNNSLIKFLIRLIFFNSISIFKLIKVVKKKKIDCIYTSTIVNYIGALVAIILKKKHIWHIHEMNNPGYQWINPKLDFIIRYFFKNSKMIFISEGVKSSWLKRFNLTEEEIEYEIIYNKI